MKIHATVNGEKLALTVAGTVPVGRWFAVNLNGEPWQAEWLPHLKALFLRHEEQAPERVLRINRTESIQEGPHRHITVYHSIQGMPALGRDIISLAALEPGIADRIAKLQSVGSIVKAPMSGTVLKVIAENGQKVAKGDPVLILEAMKMENSILAPQDGVISNLAVAQQGAVQTGQLLFEIRPENSAQ